MSNFMIMEPTNQSFQELIGNGNSYNVPRFQRDYAWEQENWEDLWSDIESLADENYHYMGYIVLQKTNDHEYEIIDGQQRIVTLSLLVLAGMRKIKDMAENDIDKDDNEKRLTALSDKFVGYLNTVTLRRKNKLSLNRNNGYFFRHISIVCSLTEVFGFYDKQFGSQLSFVLVGLWWLGFAQITYAKLPDSEKTSLPKGM